MTTGQRIAIIVVAVVVLGAGFVLAQGSGDDGGSDERTPTAVEQLGETSTGTGGAEAPAETQAPTETQAAPPPPRVETIRIRGNQPASGKTRTLKFENGDTVRLRFRSDTATEVHVHGYDKVQQIPGGGSATLRFKATLEGIFEIEDHNSGAELAKLEVQP